MNKRIKKKKTIKLIYAERIKEHMRDRYDDHVDPKTYADIKSLIRLNKARVNDLDKQDKIVHGWTYDYVIWWRRTHNRKHKIAFWESMRRHVAELEKKRMQDATIAILATKGISVYNTKENVS